MSPVVEIGLNGPPLLVPGFRSHKSIVGGPPPIHSKIADLRFFFIVSAFATIALPINVDAPTTADEPAKWFMKCRRVMPAGVFQFEFMLSCLSAKG